MACANPDVRGKLCDLGRETRKKICKRCKWQVPNSVNAHGKSNARTVPEGN